LNDGRCRQANAQRSKHAHDRAELRIAVSAQSFVKAGPAQLRLARDFSKTARASDDAKRIPYFFRVTRFKRCA
jgi:hypothetical protein